MSWWGMACAKFHDCLVRGFHGRLVGNRKTVLLPSYNFESCLNDYTNVGICAFSNNLAQF